MRESFLKYLCDPNTGEHLTLHTDTLRDDDVLEGSLSSPSNTYPIVRGVPRFAGYSASENYAASFGYEWTKWARLQFESENRGKPMEGHTRRMWERNTGIEDCDCEGKVIADFGCGPGRFIEVARQKNFSVIGLDLSAAVESARENFQQDPKVLICQADVLKSPIRSASMDGAFSFGVMHHTPEPQEGFKEMVRKVKEGGWISLSVYRKGGYYDFPTVTLLRSMFKFLWPVLNHYPPLLYAYFSVYCVRPITRIPKVGRLVKGILPLVDLPDINWSILDTFDSMTPTYQSTHFPLEVYNWFKSADLKQITPSNDFCTAYHAIKE